MMILSLVIVLTTALFASAHPIRPASIFARHHALNVALRSTQTYTAPEGWFTDYLEDYTTYHLRYLAIDCEDKHNTTFFDACCHPMLATETLANNRAPECNPANLPSSSSAPASTVAPATPASTAAPTATAPVAVSGAASSSSGSDDDDDIEECTDDDVDDDLEDCTDDEDSEGNDSADSPTQATSTTTTDDSDSDSDSEGDDSPAPSSHASPTTADAPTPKTTSTHEEEEPTTTKKADTTSSEVETKTSATHKAASTGSSSGSGAKFSGQVTWYTQDGTTGACGKKHSDSELVCAMNASQYKSLDSCGKEVLITASNGKQVKCLVADECPGCRKGDIDLSTAAFKKLGSMDLGVIEMTWQFV